MGAVSEPDLVVSAIGAQQAATDGKLLAESETREALTEAIRTREYQYNSQAALSGSDPYATIDDIREAAARSEDYSERAQRAEEASAQVLAEVNRSNWQIALDTVASTVREQKADKEFLKAH